MPPLKKQVHEAVVNELNSRIESCRQAMEFAQESANAEEKSSAGDKYETGRAMAQIERDHAARQLNELLNLKSLLDRIDTFQPSDSVMMGSIVHTSSFRFYMAISLGSVEVGGQLYMVISAQSPVGQLLMNKKVGQQIVFKNQSQTILELL
jgi:transcription elongation GreA/GreB family factor